MATWLGRWRIDGVNWEGRQWYLAPGGVALAREMNELWPEGTAADGTVASRGHDSNNPSSDHRPYPHDESPAVVRAIDVGEKVENDGQELFDLLLASRDPRIKYVLHENKIFSSYPRSNRDAWEVKEGSYGHLGHVHVSFTSLADTDDTPWNLKGDDLTPEQVRQIIREELDAALGPAISFTDLDDKPRTTRKTMLDVMSAAHGGLTLKEGIARGATHDVDVDGAAVADAVLAQINLKQAS